MVAVSLAIPLALVAIGLACISIYQVRTYPERHEVRYKSYGDPSRETIVFIPGLDGVTAFFSDIVPEITCSYHVVVYNLPLSPRQADDSTYTFDTIVEDLQSMLEELHIEKATIFGESFGGIVAQHFVHKHSERLNRLVLLSSLARAQLPPDVQFKLDYLIPVIETFGYYFPHFAQMLFAQIHVDDVVEPAEPNAVRQLFIKEASFAHFYSVVARIKLVSKLDILHLIPTIQIPTLVIFGEQDHFTKKDSLQIHELLPNSQLRSLPGGHLAHVSSPKVVAQMLLADSFRGFK